MNSEGNGDILLERETRGRAPTLSHHSACLPIRDKFNEEATRMVEVRQHVYGTHTSPKLQAGTWLVQMPHV